MCHTLACTASKIPESPKYIFEMIRPLRKYHFVIWCFWAVCLPIALGLAIIVQPQLPTNLRNVKNTFQAELKSMTDSTSLIRINVLKPISSPSCLVFSTVGNRDILLGKLDHQGPYTFIISNPKQDVILKLYDGIHKKTITSITLPLMDTQETRP